ncbi:unnamed protein product, partial [Mesorhabditis belari]|uniref:Lipocalin domain-containing protein n=1 Tax=Mesorhabditis belari TaxID=2138241 RepID=A0AAF3F3E1_9BILA
MYLLLGTVMVLGVVRAQFEPFALPSAERFAPKPTVPPEFRKYFELDGHARELVESLLGPRPGGFFPEKTYEVGEHTEPTQPGAPPRQISNLERTLEQFFTAPEESSNSLPPGFNSGFSLQNNHKQKLDKDNSGRPSISGIPNVFPKLPKVPVLNDPRDEFTTKQPVVINRAPEMPMIESAPPVPENGMLSSDIRRAPESVGEVPTNDDGEPNEGEYGGLAEETSTGGGGLIGTILNLISLGAKKAKEGPKATNESDAKSLAAGVSNLLGGENSPIPMKNFFSGALYKALTAGSILKNDTDSSSNNTELTDAQKSAIGENLEMIQNLIIQPSSPLCTSKPDPVDFDFYAILGQWYQVVYSPPLSHGPCSMVAYKKLSEVNNGGAGSLFETFEYSTDGTPYGKPMISSGYALVKSPGELLMRTSGSKEDVNIHVLHVGPLNSNSEYEYVVMSTNCNYPLYVFARDPIVYKQKYEAEVTELMEKKGWVNGFSKLLNIVSSVDSGMCTFPPSLFNLQG